MRTEDRIHRAAILRQAQDDRYSSNSAHPEPVEGAMAEIRWLSEFKNKMPFTGTFLLGVLGFSVEELSFFNLIIVGLRHHIIMNCLEDRGDSLFNKPDHG